MSALDELKTALKALAAFEATRGAALTVEQATAILNLVVKKAPEYLEALETKGDN